MTDRELVLQRYPGSVNFAHLIRGSLSPCGRFVFMGSEDGCAYVWRADSGQSLVSSSEIQFLKEKNPFCQKIHRRTSAQVRQPAIPRSGHVHYPSPVRANGRHVWPGRQDGVRRLLQGPSGGSGDGVQFPPDVDSVREIGIPDARDSRIRCCWRISLSSQSEEDVPAKSDRGLPFWSGD